MTDSRSPLDTTPKRIDLSSEEQWFVHRVLRGRLRRDPDDPSRRSVAAALGKVEAGICSFTVREAHRLREAVSDHATDPSISLFELALTMIVIERIDESFDFPDNTDTSTRTVG